MSSRRSEVLPRPLGFRLAAWYAALFVCSSLAIAVLTYFLLASSLRERDHEIVRSTLFNYATRYAQGGLPSLNEAIRTDQAAGRHERLFVRVMNADQETIFFSLPSDWNDFDLGQLAAPGSQDGEKWTSLRGRREGKALEVASALLPDGTLLQVGRSTEARDEMLARYRTVLLVVFAGIVAIALAGGAVLTRWIMTPLRNLAGAVQTIVQTGRVDARVPVAGTGDALDALTVLFNGMLDRIESLIDGMRGSLDNVAHDLRTPMTRLRATAERALQVEQDPGRLRDALADCLEESERVTAMLNTLMDIAEAETGTMRLNREPVRAAEALADALDLFSEIAEDKGVELTLDAPADIVVDADRSRLRQALANLVDNAVKYTPSGGRVSCSARVAGSEAAIEVRDTGTGIAPEDLPRIWDRLYRGDRSRSERGLGLGLSLVRAIAQAHGGRAEVRSAVGEGSVFTLHLPLAST